MDDTGGPWRRSFGSVGQTESTGRTIGVVRDPDWTSMERRITVKNYRNTGIPE